MDILATAQIIVDLAVVAVAMAARTVNSSVHTKVAIPAVHTNLVVNTKAVDVAVVIAAAVDARAAEIVVLRAKVQARVNREDSRKRLQGAHTRGRLFLRPKAGQGVPTEPFTCVVFEEPKKRN